MTKESEHMVRIGGLMRCCFPETVLARVDEDRPPTEDEILPCLYCEGRMIYRDGAWERDVSYEHETGDKS